MISNCLIRREMQKKFFLVAAENGGGCGPAAVFFKDTKTWGNY